MSRRKNIRGRKRKISGRSHRSAPPVRKTIPRAYIWGSLLCVTAAGIALLWFLSSNKDEPQNQSVEIPQSKTTTVELTPEEEIIALKEEETALARQTFTELPQSVDSCMLMGDLYARHGDSTEAVKFWEKTLEIDPDHFEALRNIGRAALEKEQFERAVTFLKKALEIKSNTPDLRSDIARALMDSGKYREAIAELKKETELFPSSFTAHFQLAEAYRQQKQYEQAVEHYEQTIKLEPEHSHAYYGLGMVYKRMDQRDKARENLATFQELRKKVDSVYSKRQIGASEDLLSLRASVVKTCLDAERLYRNNGQPAKAEELLKRAIKLEPNNTRSLERLASFYYSTNRAAKALECFEKIALIEPKNPTAYLNIGRVATVLRMSKKAESAFQKSITLAPTHPAGYQELTRFYLRTNTNKTQAYRLAKKAITLRKTAETYFLLGWAADVNGDRAGALKAMEQAIKQQPNNKKYRQIYERIKAKN